jgi:hypothetical protein
VNPTNDLAIWVAAALILCYYSGIFKENPAFRIVEHLFIGISAANSIVLTYEQFIRSTIQVSIMQNGHYELFIPVVIGCLIYTRFLPSKDQNWLARVPIAFWIGISSAIVILRAFRANFSVQLAATFLPLTNRAAFAWTGESIFNNLVIIIGVFTVLTYFFFTVEHKGALAYSAKVGRYVMMVAFGAAYGNTIMARSAVLLGRMQYLLGNWLGILNYTV